MTNIVERYEAFDEISRLNKELDSYKKAIHGIAPWLEPQMFDAFSEEFKEYSDAAAVIFKLDKQIKLN